jgi:hypothetical protein
MTDVESKPNAEKQKKESEVDTTTADNQSDSGSESESDHEADEVPKKRKEPKSKTKEAEKEKEASEASDDDSDSESSDSDSEYDRSKDKKKSKDKKDKEKEKKEKKEKSKDADKDKDKDDEDTKKKSKGKKKKGKGKKKTREIKKIRLSDQSLNVGFDLRVPPVEHHLRGFVHYTTVTRVVEAVESLRKEGKPLLVENFALPYHGKRFVEACTEWDAYKHAVHLELHPEEKETKLPAPVNRRKKKAALKKKEGKAKPKKELTAEEQKAKWEKKQEEIDKIEALDEYSKAIAKIERVRIRLNKETPRHLTVFLNRMLEGFTRNAYVNASAQGRGKIMPSHALFNASNNVPMYHVVAGLNAVRYYNNRCAQMEEIARAKKAKKSKKDKDKDEEETTTADVSDLPEFSFEEALGLPPLDQIIVRPKKTPKKKEKDGKEGDEDEDEDKKSESESESESEDEESDSESSDSDSDDEDGKKKKKKKAKKSTKTLSFTTHINNLCSSVKSKLVESARATSTDVAIKYSTTNISTEYRMMLRNIILEAIWVISGALIDIADCCSFRTINVHHIDTLLPILMSSGGMKPEAIREFFADCSRSIESLVTYNKKKNAEKNAKRAAKKAKEEKKKAKKAKKNKDKDKTDKDDDKPDEPKDTEGSTEKPPKSKKEKEDKADKEKDKEDDKPKAEKKEKKSKKPKEESD